MSVYEERYPDGSRGEVLDGTPMALPVGFRRPPSLIEQMRLMIRNEMSQAAAQKGRETFEEANDFDVADDPDDPTTPWEHAADGDEEVAQGLVDARLAQAARKEGWKPPTTEEAWQSWAKANGWVPPTPAPAAPSSRPAVEPDAGKASVPPSAGG